VITALAIVLYYLLLNAGYYMWDGGAAFGPRHVVPMLGVLMLGAWPAYRIVPRAFLVLAAVAALHMLLGAAATPEAPQHGNPLWEHAWPRASGAAPAVPGQATNLGLLLGLPGLVSLLPLLAPWLWAAPAALRNDAAPMEQD
jgi:peptidoglycan/LPS O-acetylase OafA/YrhL